MKLFGSTGGARLAKNRTAILAGSTSVQHRGSAAAAAAVPTPKKRNPLKVLAIILAIILALELCYFFVVDLTVSRKTADFVFHFSPFKVRAYILS